MNCPFCHAPQSRLEEHGATMLRCLDCQEVYPRAHALQASSRLRAGLAQRVAWKYRIDHDALCYPSVLGIQLLDLHLPDPIGAVEVLADYELAGGDRRYDCGGCADWRSEHGFEARPGRVVQLDQEDEGRSLTFVHVRWSDATGKDVDFPLSEGVRRANGGKLTERWVAPPWKPRPGLGKEAYCAGCVLSYLDRADGTNEFAEPVTPASRRRSFLPVSSLPSEKTRARFWGTLRRAPFVHRDYVGPTVDVAQLDEVELVKREGSPEPDLAEQRPLRRPVITAEFSADRGEFESLGFVRQGGPRRGYWPPWLLPWAEREMGWSASRWVGKTPYRVVG